MSQTKSIDQWLHAASQAFDEAGLFYGHGTDNAWDEAVYLISYSLGCGVAFADRDVDEPLSLSEDQKVQACVTQRIETKKPTAYLVNEAWFAGYTFYVDERVLVPRSPLAELIDEAFTPWIDIDNVKRIVDVGTGSGCIGITCALYFEHVQVELLDIDAGALAVAQKNIQYYDLAQRVQAYQSDLLDARQGQRYDIILSNPPYVSLDEYASLPDEYKQEPQLGLTSGVDGLDCVRRILSSAAQYLTPQGILIVEVGNSQVALEQAFPDVPFTWLEFEYGGSGVFLLDYSQLTTYFK